MDSCCLPPTICVSQRKSSIGLVKVFLVVSCLVSVLMCPSPCQELTGVKPGVVFCSCCPSTSRLNTCLVMGDLSHLSQKHDVLPTELLLCCFLSFLQHVKKPGFPCANLQTTSAYSMYCDAPTLFPISMLDLISIHRHCLCDNCMYIFVYMGTLWM